MRSMVARDVVGLTRPVKHVKDQVTLPERMSARMICASLRMGHCLRGQGLEVDYLSSCNASDWAYSLNVSPSADSHAGASPTMILVVRKILCKDGGGNLLLYRRASWHRLPPSRALRSRKRCVEV